MALFIEGSEKGSCHAQCDGGVRKGPEEKTEDRVDAKMHNFVIGEMDKGVDLLNTGCGEGGDTQHQGVEGGAGEKVFPWRLFHNKGILGVE